MWAVRMLESCEDDSFHPLGAIIVDEWKAEENRIANVEQEDVRQEQLAHLAEVKRVRDSAMQLYLQQPQICKTSISWLETTMKAYGVSAFTKYTFTCRQTLHRAWCIYLKSLHSNLMAFVKCQ